MFSVDMNGLRRHFVWVLSLGCLVFSVANAQPTFPTKPIKIVVPNAAGGAADITTRTVAQKLSEALGQSVVIDNKPSAGGIVAGEMVARSEPDGHTLLWGYIATHSMNPALQKLRYDPIADFEPIALVGYSPTVMVTNTKSGFSSVNELVSQLKAKPSSHAYASAGNGTAPHFAAELFSLRAGVKMLGIPYKGSAPALQDTMSGQTQVMFPSLFSAMPHVKSGRLRALAVTSSKRLTSLPDVPTATEAGLKGYDLDSWFALYAPVGTPAAVVQ